MKQLPVLGFSVGVFCLAVTPIVATAAAQVAATSELPFSDKVITYEVRNKLTLQTGYGPEDSLLGAGRETFYTLRYEPTFVWYSPEKRWPRWEVFSRGWLAYDSSKNITGFNEADEENIEGLNAELREFYVRRNLLGDDPRYSIAIGRQRYADKLGLWWDDTFESVRFDYNDVITRGFFAYGQKFYNYNTKVNELNPRDKRIHNAIGEYGWRWQDNQWTGFRLSYQKDHSDKSLDDHDDFTGWRYGAFAHGDLWDSRMLSDYHIEYAQVHGKRDNINVKGNTKTDIRGWALLTEFGKRFDSAPWQPRVVIRSGLTDKPSDDADGFFLNRIQSDRLINDETYSTRLASSFISLDVRNLLYYGIGLETRPTVRSSLDIRVTDLRVRNRESTLPIRTTESQDISSSSIGQVLDVSYYWENFPIAYAGRRFDMNTLVSAGYLFAGPATGNLENDYQLTLSVVMRY